MLTRRGSFHAGVRHMSLLTLLRAGFSLLVSAAWPPSPPRYLEPLEMQLTYGSGLGISGKGTSNKKIRKVVFVSTA